MPSAQTCVNSLFIGTLAVGVTIAQNTALTHAEKDSARLESIEREAEQDAAASIYGLDSVFGGLTRGDVLSSIRGEATPNEDVSTNLVEEELPDAGEDGGSSEQAPTLASLNDLAPTAREGIKISSCCVELPYVNLTVTDSSPARPADEFVILGTSNLTSNWAVAESYAISENETATNFPVTINWENVFSNAVACGIFPCDARLSSGFYAAAWNLDSDHDGISDLEEKLTYHTDPENLDTDGDGLDDGWEIMHGTRPDASDSDGDGLDDRLELSLGTQPLSSDSDGDGLSDSTEIGLGTDPNDSDSDGDGVSDADEVDQGSDPSVDEDSALVDPPPGGPRCSFGGNPEVSVVWLEDVSDYEELPTVEVTTSVGSVSCDGGFAPCFRAAVNGISFVPDVSGFYEFQLSADDDCVLSVGSVTLEDHYYGPHGQPMRGFFRAGVSYEVSATLENQGGPSGFGLSANLVKIYRERFEDTFGADVVIFENEYQNKPGQRVPKNSTYLESNFIVTAGPEGGTLKISGNYNAALELYAGTDIGPGEYNLGPFETKKCHGVFRGRVASGAVDDVTRVVRWQPTGSQEAMVSSNALTVVEVEVQAEEMSPIGEEHRHIFGPCESVSIVVSPQLIPHTIAVEGAVDESGVYYLSPHPGVYKIFCNVKGSDFPLQVSVIPPSDIVCTDVIDSSAQAWQLYDKKHQLPEEGWCALITVRELRPRYVCFDEVTFLEGRCPPSNIKGYFNRFDTYPESHGAQQGAWRRIAVVNGCGLQGVDIADITGLKLPRSFSSGSFTWMIPQLWCVSNNFVQTAPRQFAIKEQKFSLSADGDLTVSKYGERVTRRIIPAAFIEE